jgi:hypothetical protein
LTEYFVAAKEPVSAASARTAFFLTTDDSRYKLAVFILRHGVCSPRESSDGTKKIASDRDGREEENSLMIDDGRQYVGCIY